MASNFSCQTEQLDTFLSQLAKKSPETLRHSKFVQVDRLAKNEVLRGDSGISETLAINSATPRAGCTA